MPMSAETDAKNNLVKLRELTGAGMMECKKLVQII